MPGPGSGLGTTLGVGVEGAGSYGTYVAPTKWNAVESAVINQVPAYAAGNGLRGGTLVRDANDRVLTNLDAAGTIKMPVYYNGMGRLLGSLMGSLNVAPAQQGATTAYQQTHAFANSWNQSLTIEQQIIDVSQTSRWWRTLGAKVNEGQFDCTAGSLLNATFMVDAQDRFLNATGAAVTQPTNNPPFAFHQMKVKIGTFGAEAQVDGVIKWQASIKRARADKRFNIGNLTTNPSKVYGVKNEPVDNGFAAITGTLDTEYLSEALFDNYYQTETPFSMIAVFTSAVLAGTAFPYSISFNFPRCYFIKGDPDVQGPDIVKPSMPFEVWYDETHPAATITVVAQDVTL
jgi:hypothetical protein